MPATVRIPSDFDEKPFQAFGNGSKYDKQCVGAGQDIHFDAQDCRAMSAPTLTQRSSNPAIGVLFILLAMFSISINDMLIKQMSGGYRRGDLLDKRCALMEDWERFACGSIGQVVALNRA